MYFFAHILVKDWGPESCWNVAFRAVELLDVP